MNTDVEKISQAIFSIKDRSDYSGKMDLGTLTRVDLGKQKILKTSVRYICRTQDGFEVEAPDEKVLYSHLKRFLTGYLIKKGTSNPIIVEYQLTKAATVQDANVIFVIADDTLYNAHDFLVNCYGVDGDHAISTLDALGQNVKAVYATEEGDEFCAASLAFPSMLSLMDDDIDLSSTLNGCVSSSSRSILIKHGCEGNLKSLLITCIM